MIDIVIDLIPEGSPNRPGQANPCNYITIHNTGNWLSGTNARMHARYVKTRDAQEKKVSWHYTVDEKEIIQHIPDEEVAYHAGDGDGPGNRESIGIEICMNIDGSLLMATNKAVALAAALLRKHGLSIDCVVQHHHWSKKDCPELLRSGKPYSWESFLEGVRACL